MTHTILAHTITLHLLDAHDGVAFEVSIIGRNRNEDARGALLGIEMPADARPQPRRIVERAAFGFAQHLDQGGAHPRCNELDGFVIPELDGPNA